MSNLEQKADTKAERKVKYDSEDDDSRDNLGLDADHSSDDTEDQVNYNNDNDRISHNPDGEDDDSDSTEERGHSPLMDK